MARTANKTTNAAVKVTAKTAPTTEENISVIEEPVEEAVETPIVQAPKKFEATDPIRCVSITAGELRMMGLKSGINYSWAGRGDETEVEYQDIVAAIRSSKKHIYTPFIIIQDKELLAQFPQVEKIYSSLYSIKDLKDVLKLSPAQMRQIILSLPDGAKESIKNIASSMVSSGTLDSVQKIKVLDEIFDTKLMLMTELFN